MDEKKQTDQPEKRPRRLRRRGSCARKPRMDPTNEYRAKAFECLSLAESMNNPEERAEMLRFARMWLNLAEPIDEIRGAYESPRRR